MYTLSFICVLTWIITGFFLSRLFKRNDVADGMWGMGFVFIAVTQIIYSQIFSIKTITVLILTCIWGVRLSIYLWKRLLSHTEDKRYKKMLKYWKRSEASFAFFKVFLLQGSIMALVSLPITHIMHSSQTIISPWDFVGITLVIIGIFFEIVSDSQLAHFKKMTKDKLLQHGLWKYCRHPNYFGEILFWWGIFFFALSQVQGWITIISPLLITFLLYRVSGVPMIEKEFQKKREGFKSFSQNVPRIIIPFSNRSIYSFLIVSAFLIILDSFWLGYIMRDFYSEQAAKILKTSGNEWDPILWAVVGVYICIALGLQFFALKKDQTKGDSFFNGAIFGLVTYGIYEYTNLALVKNWPIEMAFIDILWGPILCGSSCFLTKVIIEKMKTT